MFRMTRIKFSARCYLVYKGLLQNKPWIRMQMGIMFLISICFFIIFEISC